MIDAVTAQSLAKELNIDSFTIYREYLQILFLKNVFSLTGSDKLFFKGGTAIRFLLKSFRFSEDLDFSAQIPKAQVKALISRSVDLIKKEMDVEFKEEGKFPDAYTGKLYQHLSGFKFPLTIKVEVSLRGDVVSYDTDYAETIFPVSPYPLVTHLGFEEILAEKIRALVWRGKGRDIFDFWFLLSKGIKLNWQLINRKMKIYNRKVDSESLRKVIQDFSDEEIEKDLKRFLPLSERKIVSKIKKISLDKYNAAL